MRNPVSNAINFTRQWGRLLSAQKGPFPLQWNFRIRPVVRASQRGVARNHGNKQNDGQMLLKAGWVKAVWFLFSCCKRDSIPLGAKKKALFSLRLSIIGNAL
jgi:hypothetical protein